MNSRVVNWLTLFAYLPHQFIDRISCKAFNKIDKAMNLFAIEKYNKNEKMEMYLCVIQNYLTAKMMSNINKIYNHSTTV